MAYEGWMGFVPPASWERVLAMDIGGATPNNMEWAAICPETQSLVFHSEVNKITTDMREMVKLAQPFMKSPNKEEYNFRFKAGDYENRIALDEMGRNGITFTNAVKQNKLKSVHRFASYLHPNPLRAFPSWHPLAGKLGAPLVFISPECKTLIREIPQQKWKTERAGDSMLDELDRAVRHDAVDCALYIVRLLPAPNTIPLPKVAAAELSRQALMSKLYWEDAKKFAEKHSDVKPRKKYNPSHGGAHWRLSLFGSFPQ